MERKEGFGQGDTIARVLDSAGRRTSSAPIRREFVQGGTQKRPIPGPLAKFVTTHDEAGLELFLLLRAVASKEPWDVIKEAGVWARALGVAHSDKKLNTPAVSRVFARLDTKHNLLDRGRSGRRLKATMLHEDGSRSPYTMPDTGYFRLPFAYWTDGWYLKLSMPAKAVLLIGMSLTPPFILPFKQMPKWYGISGDSVSKGIAELKKRKLLRARRGKKRDWLVGSGWRHEMEYTLQPPFHRKRKAAASTAAAPTVTTPTVAELLAALGGEGDGTKDFTAPAEKKRPKAPAKAKRRKPEK